MSVEFHDSDVFQRTRKGQQEAVFDRTLDTEARRLLLLVNGFMPLGMLRELLKDEDAVGRLLEQLYVAGLIAPATMLAPMERHTSLVQRLEPLAA